ncbi:hypothetical protein [Pseudomonas putida]|uniref:Fap system outer membrane protein n=1 Tax=Pseudomonas putida TaxID=303 RepID=A0A1Q9R309_PSEPU|nr:hypothetical protein [Pseudomonas putida]OLS61800.1 hypothetical protein PSEMO_33440 [Pseudomonas putida]
MKTSSWLVALCVVASLPLPVYAQFKPIEVKDQELAQLRGRYVMPGRIISFGVVMSSTWQNANGDRIGATASLQVQQSSFKPQFYVSTTSEAGSGASTAQGYGTVSGGAGLANGQGVTQVTRAAGDYNASYNDVQINVKEATQAPAMDPVQGQALPGAGVITASNNAGLVSVSSAAGGIQMGIQAANGQGASLQRIADGGVLQSTTLLGGRNAVSNVTQLNVVLRSNMPTTGQLNCNLDQLKGLRISGY